MSPECWKRKYGEPCCASDIFSLGMMMWEMLARSRISENLLDKDNLEHTCMGADGLELDASLVPALLIRVSSHTLTVLW